MTKTITPELIEAIKNLGSFSEDTLKNTVSRTCCEYVLNEDFVDEFSSVISKQDFSTSLELSRELVENYPELFDRDIWVEHGRSIYPLLSGDILNSLSEDQVINIINRTHQMDRAFFEELLDKVNTNERKLLMKTFSRYMNDKLFIKYCDEIPAEAFYNPDVFKKLSTDTFEEILKRTPHKIDYVLGITCAKNDVGWQTKIFKEALNGEIPVEASGNTYDSEFANLLNIVNFNNYKMMFELLLKYAPNSLTPALLTKLISKHPDEELCRMLYDAYKRCGLKNTIDKYLENFGELF